MSGECMDEQKLFLYTHQMLEASQVSPLRAHLAECARCRGVVESYQNLSSVLDEWKAPESSPWFDARVRAAIAASKPLGRWNFNLRRWTALLGVAAVAVLVLCAILLVNRGLVNPKAGHRYTSNRQPQSLAAQSRATARSSDQNSSAKANQQVSTGHSGIRTGEPNAADSAQAEDDEMLSSFDVLSELPRPQSKQVDN